MPTRTYNLDLCVKYLDKIVIPIIREIITNIKEKDLSGSGDGYWLAAGVFMPLRQFNVGCQLRFSSAKAEMKGYDLSGPVSQTDVNIGGTHFGVLLGYHW